MPRSKQQERRNPALFVFLLALLACPAFAAKPYHLQLEAYPAAPFPWLSKFGKVTLHVYPGGVRAETIWLNGFSRNGDKIFTIENPYGRMYSEMPLSEIAPVVTKLAGHREAWANDNPPVLAPMTGSVRGVAAQRYRLVYGPEAFIDVWTTTTIADNPQLRAIAMEFVRSIAPGTATAMQKIPGMPLYIELNFRSFKKLPLLRMTKVEDDAKDEADALKRGTLYFKAPYDVLLWR
jgi:hypothetical protein